MSRTTPPSSTPPRSAPQTGIDQSGAHPGTGAPRILDGWGTRVGVILAVAGSAVGLGNFLRFPGQAADNGGGLFMIPYFISLIVMGIPLCWAEWTMGREGGRYGFHSAPAIFGAIGRKKSIQALGLIGTLIPLVVFMYYVVIESWCLVYALSYLFGTVNLGADPANYTQASKGFFSSVVGIDANGSIFSAERLPYLLAFFAVFALNFYLIFLGIAKGIERFCRYAMPLMLLCAVIVLVRVLTLGTPNPELPEQNVLNGLGFMWNPKSTGASGLENSPWWYGLLNSKIWLAAAGQVFFSLSVGFGVIITYASYLKQKDDVVLSGLTAASTNEFFEVCLGGLITIPAAFIFLGAAGAIGGTFGLGFNTLPVVFMFMPGGDFFGFLWFLMLFLAAVTSSISMLQPVLAFLSESLHCSKRTAVMLLVGITGAGSLFVLYFSAGLQALDTMDFWVGTALIFVLATIQTILFGWVFGVERGVKAAEVGSAMSLPRLFPFVIKYISPVFLLLIFFSWCYQELPGYIAGLSKGGVPLYAVLMILATVSILFVIWLVGTRRWSYRLQDE